MEASVAPLVCSSERRGCSLPSLFAGDGMYSRQWRVLFKGGADSSHGDSCMQLVMSRNLRSNGDCYAVIRQPPSSLALLSFCLYLHPSQQESKKKLKHIWHFKTMIVCFSRTKINASLTIHFSASRASVCVSPQLLRPISLCLLLLLPQTFAHLASEYLVFGMHGAHYCLLKLWKASTRLTKEQTVYG